MGWSDGRQRIAAAPFDTGHPPRCPDAVGTQFDVGRRRNDVAWLRSEVDRPEFRAGSGLQPSALRVARYLGDAPRLRHRRSRCSGLGPRNVGLAQRCRSSAPSAAPGDQFCHRTRSPRRSGSPSVHPAIGPGWRRLRRYRRGTSWKGCAVSGIVVLIAISFTWVLFFGGIWLLIRSRRAGAIAPETSPPANRPE